MNDLLNQKTSSVKAWVREAFCLINLGLESGPGAEFVISKVLRSLPVDPSLSINRKRALLFVELKKRLLKECFKENKPNHGQMELFVELDKSNEKEEEALVLLRNFEVQAFVYSRMGEAPPLNDRAVVQASIPLDWILEFISHLDEETNDSAGLHHHRDPERTELISRYLLGMLSDAKATEVEKKLRQNTDWQKSKLWTGELITRFEESLHRYNQCDATQAFEYSTKLENSLIGWFLGEGEIVESSQVNQFSEGRVEEKEVADRTPVPRFFNLSPSQIFTWVGLFSCMIGYFGWKEKKEELSLGLLPLPHEVSLADNEPFPSGLEQISNLPSIVAEDVAGELLGNRTIDVLREMESKIDARPLLDTKAYPIEDFTLPGDP